MFFHFDLLKKKLKGAETKQPSIRACLRDSSLFILSQLSVFLGPRFCVFCKMFTDLAVCVCAASAKTTVKAILQNNPGKVLTKLWEDMTLIAFNDHDFVGVIWYSHEGILCRYSWQRGCWRRPGNLPASLQCVSKQNEIKWLCKVNNQHYQHPALLSFSCSFGSSDKTLRNARNPCILLLCVISLSQECKELTTLVLGANYNRDHGYHVQIQPWQTCAIVARDCPALLDDRVDTQSLGQGPIYCTGNPARFRFSIRGD